MTTEEIFDKVRYIICEQFGIDEDDVTMESLLEDDFSADSVDLVDLAVELETEFEIGETEESVLEAIKTVSDVVNYIHRKLNA